MSQRGESRSKAMIGTVVWLWAGTGVMTGLPQTDSRVCGFVEVVSCKGPGAPATMQLIVPGGRLLKGNRVLDIVIPAPYRGSFGMRVEDVFEQQSVCVTGTTLTDAVEKVVIERPEQLKVAEPRNAPAIYPPDVFRSCDAGVQPPVVVRERKPMWPVGRKVGGTVVLRAVVDPTGRVRDMRIVRSVDPSMDAAVQDAVGEWRFRSGVLNGAPVPVVVTIEVTMAGS